MELRRVEGLPPGLLDADAHQLAELLGGPTLLRLKGRASAVQERENSCSAGETSQGMSFSRPQRPNGNSNQRLSGVGFPESPLPLTEAHQGGLAPLFISVLLHGNETSGWEGLRRVLQAGLRPERDLLIFFGNLAAAAAKVRTLPRQADFNRIWRPAAGIAAEVLGCIGELPLMAVVDLHNNTGKNPHYAVLTDLSPGNLGLARLFGDVAVQIEEPASVLTRALGANGPSIAVELGPIGDPDAADRAADYLTALFRLPEAPLGRVDELRLFRALARVHVPEDAAFGFAGLDAGKDFDLILDGDLQANNFHPIPPGTAFGVAATALPCGCWTTSIRM